MGALMRTSPSLSYIFDCAFGRVSFRGHFLYLFIGGKSIANVNIIRNFLINSIPGLVNLKKIRR